MPDRVVKERLLTDDDINTLSWAAEVFYRRLYSIVDDYGRCEARPALLRASLYPLKLDRVSESDVIKWRGECSNTGCIRLYTVGNKDYLEILNFGQRLRAMKSKYPPPPGNAKQLPPPIDIGPQLTTSADSCQQMPAVDGLKRNESETETETEKKYTPNGVGEANASLPDPVSVYKQLEKNKKSIFGFLKAYKPLFIEPYVDLWNVFAEEKGLAKVTKISDQRKRKFRVRIKEAGFDFLEILKKAGQSEFLLTGKWFCFDWLLENESNYQKVIEGNYDTKVDPESLQHAAKKDSTKSFAEEIRYLINRCKEGDLDERLIHPEYYDNLQVKGYIPVGTVERQPGTSIDEKKRQAVLEFIKTNADVE